MDKNWHSYFNSKILKRGLDYYKSGAVEELVFDKDKKMLTAEVYGTDVYNVTIFFKNKRIESMDCDCPYALDSDNCKHMAAVLYAFEHGEEKFFKEPKTSKVSLEEAVEALSEKKAKEFLFKYAQKSSELRDCILLSSCKEISSGQKHSWQREIEKISSCHGADCGYVDYYQAYDYTSELINFLREKADLLIDNDLFSDAFELVCMVYKEAFSVDMDDSDGGLCELECICDEYWTETVENVDIEAKRAMYRWFKKEFNSGNYHGILFTGFQEDEFLKENLSILDNEIENYSEEFEYNLEYFVSNKCEIMYKLKFPSSEIGEFRNKYRHLHGVRLQEINQYISQKKYAEAIKCIKDSKQLDSKTGYLSGWSEMLMNLYKKTHNDDEYKNELEFYVLNCRQDNLDKINELKKRTSPQQWEFLRERILASGSVKWIICDLLYSEDLYERLLDYLKKSGSIEQLFKYEKKLKKAYPEELRDIILKYSDHLIDYSNDRDRYNYAASVLSKARTYPNGKKLTEEMAMDWVKRYPRKRAMIEELRNAGFEV